MINSTTKKGRPQAFYRASWGENIQGLTRLADGRWKVSGPPVVKFSERDEHLAVARFHQIMAQRKGETYTLEPVTIDTTNNEFGNQLAAILAFTKTSVHNPPARDGDKITYRPVVDEAAFWARVRQEIITRPLFVAKMTGIEQIGYLDKLLKPADSPTLESLIELYAAKPGLSSNEASRSRLFWKEFSKVAGVTTAGEIDHDVIAKYEAAILRGSYKPKSILHRYRKVRTVLAFAIKRGKGVEDCRKALDITAMLEVKDAQPLDPRPISTTDFWAIHTAAIQAGDTTFACMMLTAANMAAYAGEVSALRWDEINIRTGELITRRPKTEVSRIAVLWPEVLTALKSLDHDRETVFNTKVRSFTVFSALASWRKYREAAKLSDGVVFGGIRDFSFTVACGVSLDQARLIAGHRLPGQSDAYLRRAPQQVAEACLAIHDELYNIKKKSKRK